MSGVAADPSSVVSSVRPGRGCVEWWEGRQGEVLLSHCEPEGSPGGRCLAEAGADLNQAMNEATPLFIASQNGHVDVVRYLHEARADLNQAMNGGAIPLYVASYKGHQTW